MFEPKLFRVGKVLILASAAIAEVTAGRRDALGGGLQNTQQTRASEPGFDFGQLYFHRFAKRHEGDKDYKITRAAHAIAAERDVVDR